MDHWFDFKGSSCDLQLAAEISAEYTVPTLKQKIIVSSLNIFLFGHCCLSYRDKRQDCLMGSVASSHLVLDTITLSATEMPKPMSALSLAPRARMTSLSWQPAQPRLISKKVFIRTLQNTALYAHMPKKKNNTNPQGKKEASSDKAQVYHMWFWRMIVCNRKGICAPNRSVHISDTQTAQCGFLHLSNSD